MPKLLPVHYQTHPLAAHCGASPLDPGTVTMIGTSDPAGVTCPQCLGSPEMAGFTPITETEHAGIMRRARTSLREAVEPFDRWHDAQLRAQQRRFNAMLALDALYRETPWWALATRHFIRQALAKVNS